MTEPSSYLDGYDTGHAVGRVDGWCAGYRDGYDAGVVDGLAQGRAELEAEWHAASSPSRALVAHIVTRGTHAAWLARLGAQAAADAYRALLDARGVTEPSGPASPRPAPRPSWPGSPDRPPDAAELAAVDSAFDTWGGWA